MAKHQIQNLGASSGPQPSGSKNGRRTYTHTHTRLRLVQKTQLMLHTNTQRMESVQLASTWISLIFVVLYFRPLQAASQGTESFDVLHKEQLRRANPNPCTNSLPHWLNAHHGAPRLAQAARSLLKRERLQCRIHRERKCHQCRFLPHDIQMSHYHLQRKHEKHRSASSKHKFRKLCIGLVMNN